MFRPTLPASRIDSNSTVRLDDLSVPLVGLWEWRYSVPHHTTSMPFVRVGRESLRVTMSAPCLRGRRSGWEFGK